MRRKFSSRSIWRAGATERTKKTKRKRRWRNRGKGYAGECLDYAGKIAEQENCYKMILLTGSKSAETLRFYERAGYNSSDKTAFVQWIGLMRIR